MSAEKYSRSVTLVCPTCANDQFEVDGDTASVVRCPSCGRQFEKSELIDANSENVEEHVREISAEIEADFVKALKQSLRGNKMIKLK